MHISICNLLFFGLGGHLKKGGKIREKLKYKVEKPASDSREAFWLQNAVGNMFLNLFPQSYSRV